MEQMTQIFTGVLGIAFWLIGYVVLAMALMTIAKKRNLENTWFAWVPILNLVLMLQIAGLEIWMIILLLIPCVNFFFAIYVWWKIAESQGKPGPLGILMIVPVVNLLVILYIAYSD